MEKCAIITGIYGQDGSLLAEHLLANKYRVLGLVSKSRPNFAGLELAEIIEADISDPLAMRKLFLEVRPDECYHLAAAHHSSEEKTESDVRAEMLRVNFLSTQVILDALLETAPDCRFLYAGSSQMYSPESDITVVDESTRYRPISYYGITKVASAVLIDFLRRERKLWGVTAILFNHESTRRDARFLSRKITRSVAEICGRKSDASLLDVTLPIRDIRARTDRSAATDFVRAFHLSLQANAPKDYVLASGKVHSVSEMLEEAFQAAELDWRSFVHTEKSSDSSPRPCLQGNPQRAQEELGWQPQKSFSALIREMVEHDLRGLSLGVVEP
jgi:GDPmannose 4,6-dehydratase